ncbi:MAG: hypothetical protein MUE78_07980 [Ilumatobacteraceae bacterium]|jgi:hypothetical protein|nr:hypothetical protein [Ilumatobacteraceae bacterium]
MRPIVVLVLGAALALAACGDESDPVEEIVDEVVQPVVTAVQDGLAGIDDAGGIACEAERAALQTALEAKQLLDGEAEVTEEALVPDFLREPSQRWDIVDGQIVPAPGSPCA